MHNRIWLAGILVLLLVFSIVGWRSATPQLLALEQEARCGTREHVHTAQCYDGSTLTCLKTAHSHNENCYLVLLEDNDINDLLSVVDASGDRSLEAVIVDTLKAAMPSAAEPLNVTQLNIAAINDTLQESGASTVVFNENLYKAASTGPTDLALPMAVDSDGETGSVALLSVGDTAQTGTYKANFYVNLDGTWVCIGTMAFETYRNGFRYGARIGTADMVEFINQQLDTDLTRTDFALTYATSENAADYSWTAATIGTTYTTFGTNYGRTSQANPAKYIRMVDENAAPMAFYTVTYAHADGTSQSAYVLSGTTVTLPDADRWSDGTSEYAGGETVTITGTTTFTALASAPDSSIRVAYTVNFPTRAGSFSNTVTVPSSPTLLGTTSTSLRDTVEENAGTVLRDVSAREVAAATAHQAGFRYMYYFSGWQTESGELLSPNSNLAWDVLQAYDANNDGVVLLTGQWEHGRAVTVNFCVRYDSKTGQSDTSSSKYTPSIYTAYVGGGGNLSLEGLSDEEPYTLDQQIRALYGTWSGDVWLSSSPSDEFVFEQLKKYTAQLTVEGEDVRAEDLNSAQYAIRWYKIFEDGSDGWHIDGRLVRKKGQITVDKEFFGNADVIKQAESGFYMEAVNGTLDADGVFSPYDASHAHYHQYILVLDQAVKTALESTYPNAVFLVYDSTSEFADGEGYQWLIEDVELGEYWQITEHPVDVPGNMYYAEYSVYDTDGESAAIAEYGTAASVIGKTFALDEDPDQGLMVDFRNYYYPTESILIKKEDADTGQPIGNAVFGLWQYNSENVLTPLTFSYDSGSGQYTFDNNGSLTNISTGDAGYTAITTTGFSYDHGAVVVKELIAPTGYAAAPNVTLSTQDGSVVITVMEYEDGTVIPQSQWNDFAEVYQDGSTLVVKNHSTALTSLTVNKAWADDAATDSVTVVLQANGITATNLFPGLLNVRTVLSAANDWKYTWTDLPTYANGTLVTWSVKEILVGSETTTSDGVSFANWTVVYSQPVRTDSDGDGITDHWQYTVTNAVRRAQLYLIKTSAGGVALPGATFALVEADTSGAPVSGAVVHTGTTGSGGMLQFDNLKYATRYRLVETGPPDGYLAYTEPAYLTLSADGTVLVEDHTHVTAGTGGYAVQIVNYAPSPLPNTGGFGRWQLPLLGGCLMMTAIGAYAPAILRKRRRVRSAK